MTPLRITAGTLALGAAALLGTATAASATPAPTAPSPADLAAAQQAATGQLPQIGRFFAAHGQGRQVAPAAAAAEHARLTAAPVPVYELDPAFVTGRAAAPGRLAYLASPAAASDGQTASVWSARVRGAWKVVNIASGTDEQKYARAAGAGSTAFHEPQIDAWYALRGSTVVPLNAPARTAGASLPLAAYQRLVHQRYADKLPGSSYARQGAAGGYGFTAPSAGGGLTGPPAGGLGGPSRPAAHDGGSGSWTLLAGAGGVGAAALTGGVLLARRRRVAS
ncbi:hypothetical protein [Actinomadura rupiterrae]|uniref:hypothetical protein n=1 Tax=Actinomadura rupiterrae TaxID=559627 RepID=UPI0020A487FF|nr:hypothetical protein [Actinomadura rupiterrae]MCP2341291.1 hypothetical protein [Actinomadura rupiterrae]